MYLVDDDGLGLARQRVVDGVDSKGAQPVPKVVYGVDSQCFFCDGTSRYGVPENLTTG